MVAFRLFIPVLMMTACAPLDEFGQGAGRIIALMSPTGASSGGVQIEPRAGGTYLKIAAQGLSPGEHGIHLHAVGRCDVPTFESAGAHWNPAGKQHGHLNPLGAHAGDLPNIIVSGNGRGEANFLAVGALADSDGTSLVIHRQPDDYRTEPSGNSGDRVACAVIAPPLQ